MSKEHAPEPAGWLTARRYLDARSALRAYERTRDLLCSEELDASVTRLMLNGVSYVTMLGEIPLTALQNERLADELNIGGEPVELPELARQHVQERRRAFKGLHIDYLEVRSISPA